MPIVFNKSILLIFLLIQAAELQQHHKKTIWKYKVLIFQFFPFHRVKIIETSLSWRDHHNFDIYGQTKETKNRRSPSTRNYFSYIYSKYIVKHSKQREATNYQREINRTGISHINNKGTNNIDKAHELLCSDISESQSNQLYTMMPLQYNNLKNLVAWNTKVTNKVFWFLT